MVSACRTGVRLTPSLSASCSSTSRSSGPYSPVRIKARNRSRMPKGRDSLPTSRKTRPTQTSSFGYGVPLVYNLRRLRILCQRFQVRGPWRPALMFFQFCEHGASGDQGAFAEGERSDDAGVWGKDGLLHLHGFENEEELSLFDLLALFDEHPHDGAWHGGGEARRGPGSGLFHGRRRGFAEHMGLSVQGDEYLPFIEYNPGLDRHAVYEGAEAAVSVVVDLDDGLSVFGGD